MKTCPRCGDILPESEFYRDRTKPSGLMSYCKACARANSRGWERGESRLGSYPVSELRWRPIEQIVEDLPVRHLGKALGVNKDTAGKIKCDMSACVDTALEMTDQKVRMIWAYLEQLPQSSR